MIDSHIHVVPPALPGVGSLGLCPEGGPAAVAARLREEMDAGGIDVACCMGHAGGSPDDPLGVLSTLEMAVRVPGLFAIGIADPRHDEPDHFRRVESALA